MTKSIKPQSVFIGLGSNQENPAKQIQTATQTISNHPEIKLLKSSSLYSTKPYGHIQDQSDFINAVIKIETQLDCFKLFQVLKNIEVHQKRVKTERWGPRIIDLDILAYENLVITTETLSIPHKDIANRSFVIMPWHEIEPEWQLPNSSVIADILENLKSSNRLLGITKLPASEPAFDKTG